MLEVRLLGKFEIRVDGQSGEMSVRAAQALLSRDLTPEKRTRFDLSACYNQLQHIFTEKETSCSSLWKPKSSTHDTCS